MKRLKKKDIVFLKKEAEFLAALARRCSEDLQIIKALADIYTRCGEHAKALEMDKKLAEKLPQDPIVWYNLACSYALLKRQDEAFDCLERSIALGYSNISLITSDKDLKFLHKDPRFASIVRRLFHQLNKEQS